MSPFHAYRVSGRSTPESSLRAHRGATRWKPHSHCELLACLAAAAKEPVPEEMDHSNGLRHSCMGIWRCGIRCTTWLNDHTLIVETVDRCYNPTTGERAAPGEMPGCKKG
jgi:hypothetical protein